MTTLCSLLQIPAGCSIVNTVKHNPRNPQEFIQCGNRNMRIWDYEKAEQSPEKVRVSLKSQFLVQSCGHENAAKSNEKWKFFMRGACLLCGFRSMRRQYDTLHFNCFLSSDSIPSASNVNPGARGGPSVISV